MPRLDRTNAVHHVYRCFDQSGRLIYVGSTANLFGRLAQHKVTAWWAPTVARVEAKVYPNGVVARDAEREAIRGEVPRWNKAGKWAGRHLWTREDWLDWITLQLHDWTPGGIWAPRGLVTAIRDFQTLFGEPLPEPYASRVEALEDAGRATRVKRELEDREKAAEVRRQDELGAARERKERIELGAPLDCVCLIESVIAGVVDEYCDAHDDLESEATS